MNGELVKKPGSKDTFQSCGTRIYIVRFPGVSTNIRKHKALFCSYGWNFTSGEDPGFSQMI